MISIIFGKTEMETVVTEFSYKFPSLGLLLSCLRSLYYEHMAFSGKRLLIKAIHENISSKNEELKLRKGIYLTEMLAQRHFKMFESMKLTVYSIIFDSFCLPIVFSLFPVCYVLFYNITFDSIFWVWMLLFTLLRFKKHQFRQMLLRSWFQKNWQWNLKFLFPGWKITF